MKEVTKHIQTVTRDMIDTMIEADGVGLAAPQIGIMKRMFVCRPELEDPEHNYVFINPEILEKEGQQDSMEGCLSVPGYIGHVVRPEKVRIQGLDAEGEMQDLVFDGFAATGQHLSRIRSPGRNSVYRPFGQRDDQRGICGNPRKNRKKRSGR